MEQTLDSVSENQKSLEANMSSVMRSVREMHNLLAANLNLPKGSLPGSLAGAPSHGQLQGALADVRPDPMQHTYSNPPSDASRAKSDLVFVHAEKEREQDRKPQKQVASGDRRREKASGSMERSMLLASRKPRSDHTAAGRKPTTLSWLACADAPVRKHNS